MKFKSLIPSNDTDGYLALTEDGTFVGFTLEEDWDDDGKNDGHRLTAHVTPVSVVIPPSVAPPQIPTLIVPEPGRLYQSRTCPEVRWVVMSVDPKARYQIQARRCDAQDQTHVGCWTFECFAEHMTPLQVLS